MESVKVLKELKTKCLYFNNIVKEKSDFLKCSLENTRTTMLRSLELKLIDNKMSHVLINHDIELRRNAAWNVYTNAVANCLDNKDIKKKEKVS